MKKERIVLWLSLFLFAMSGRGQTVEWQIEHLSTHQGLASNVVNTLMQDQQGYIWLGTNYGVSRYDGYAFQHYYYEPEGVRQIENVSSMVEDTLHHCLWLVGNDYRILCFDLRTMRFVTDYDTTQVILPDEWARTIDRPTAERLGIESRNLTGRRHKVHSVTLPNGTELYATLDNGLYVRQPSTGQLTHYSTTDSLTLIESDNISDILLDRSGCVWLPTWQSGLYKLRSVDSRVMKCCRLDVEERDEQAVGVRSFSELPDGTVALSNMDGRLFRYHPTTGRQELMLTSSARIYTTATDAQGRLWFGTRGDGLWRDGQPVGEAEGLQARQIYDILFDPRGTAWVASLDHGLWQGQPRADGTYRFRQVLKGERLHELCFDKQGRLWMTAESGLYVRDGHRTFKLGNGIATLSVCRLPDGTMLVGSVGRGLLRLRFEKGRAWVRFLTADDGLASNIVKAVVCDKSGNVYAATDAGVSFISHQGQTIHNFYSPRGLLADSYHENSALLTRDGRVLLGSAIGFVEMNGSALEADVPAPAACVTSVEVNDVPLRQGDFGELQLEHGQNNLRFSFSSFLYADQMSVVFSYWLEGFDRDWKPATKQTVALYNNLKPGHYRFHLRAALAGRPWGEPTVCDIRIAAPWWQRWWARLLMVVLTLGVVFYVWYTLRRILHLHSDLETERRLSDMKMDFFDRIQRELRSPVNVLQGASEQVGVGGASKTTVRNIRVGSKRVLRLLDMLQQFTHLNSVELQVQAEKEAMAEQTEARFMEIRRAIRSEERELRELAPPPLNPETVMLVVPDEDQRVHLKSMLWTYFKVVEQADFAVLAEDAPQPDIVVIDMTDHEKDGLDFVRQLHTGADRPSVVVLTASADEALELRSLKAGADDFQRLPCSGRVLAERVMKLVARRREASVVKHETSGVEHDERVESVKPVLSTDADHRFLERLEHLTAENMHSPDFTATSLAEKLRMGRTTLAQKIKQLTGQTPASYIEETRWKHCLHLLQTSDLAVGEIAYRCGFRTQSYFNVKFRERFGCSPREWVKSHV